MPEGVALRGPFVCKWFGAHYITQRFNTQKELEHHVYNDHKDLAELKTYYRGCPIYQCPWEGCEMQLSDIPKLKGIKNIPSTSYTLRPFKCPICYASCQFESLDKLNQHLILNHYVSVVDSTGTVDMIKQEKGDTFGQKHTVKKINIYENEDLLACKGLAKFYDRKDFEKLLVEEGITNDMIDFDEFFS